MPSSTSFQQQTAYDVAINRILDLTLGRYTVAQSDPRNIGPFMVQCKRDITDVLDTFAQRQNANSRQTSRPGSALNSYQNQQSNYHSGMHQYLQQKENGNDDVCNTNNNNNQERGDDAFVTGSGDRTEKEESLFKSLLQSQTNESAWKDMCSELVDELESSQAKSNEVKGQLDRREALLKEMRIAYFTEISHLREMVRQFRTKGSCALPEMSTFNWKDDAILTEQLMREQKQKHDQNLEDERVRHQRELDLAYERYIKVNEHLRNQVSTLEREKRAKIKNRVSCQVQTSFKFDNAEKSASASAAQLGSFLSNAVDLENNNGKKKNTNKEQDHDRDDDDEHSNFSMSTHDDDDDDENGESDEEHDEEGVDESASQCVRRQPSESISALSSPKSNKLSPHQTRNSNNKKSNSGSGKNPESGAETTTAKSSSSRRRLRRRKSEDAVSPNNNVPLSRLASNFDKQSASFLPVPNNNNNNSDSNVVTPLPLLESQTPDVANFNKTNGNNNKIVPVKRIDSPLKTSPITFNRNTNNNSNNINNTSIRPAAKKSPSPPTSGRGGKNRATSPVNPPTSSRPTSGRKSTAATFLDRVVTSGVYSKTNNTTSNGIAGVSEKTLTTLMDNHKRAMEHLRVERDSAVSRLNAAKEQLTQSLKKIDKLVADGIDREEEITDLRNRIEGGGGVGASGDNNSNNNGNNKNAIEIKATNLKLREELLKKNQILEARTKELIQLQEETARWFEAFRAIHPADRSPINYAVLERLAVSVQKAEKAEEKYRASTWALMTTQLRHGAILEKMKEEAKELQARQVSDPSAIAESRKLQKHIELVFSQLWRHASRIRNFRARCKNEANVAWDIVLFTARALVNHEDIAVVNEFFTIVNESSLKQKDKDAFLLLEQAKSSRKQNNSKTATIVVGVDEGNDDDDEHNKKNANQTKLKRPLSAAEVTALANVEFANRVIKGTTERRKSPPTIIGHQGVADIDELHGNIFASNANNDPINSTNITSTQPLNSSRSRALMKKPVRPGSAISTTTTTAIVSARPQTPISAVSDLRCLPLSQIPTTFASIPSASLANVFNSANIHNNNSSKVVRNLHSALHRKQRFDDLETRQRNVDEIRMRTLRYYSNHRSANNTNNSNNNKFSAASPSQNNSNVVEDPFSPSVQLCLHQAKLFGRNENNIE